MCKTFNELANGSERVSATRALQLWQFLIAKAANRQIVRYNELSKLIGYTDNRPLGVILDCIMSYCKANDLAPLTINVVNQKGIPGKGFSADDPADFHQRREDVFGFDWFGIVPPTVEELHLARLNS